MGNSDAGTDVNVGVDVSVDVNGNSGVDVNVGVDVSAGVAGGLRWRACLHEAGHVVAGVVLMGHPVVATSSAVISPRTGQGTAGRGVRGG